MCSKSNAKVPYVCVGGEEGHRVVEALDLAVSYGRPALSHRPGVVVQFTCCHTHVCEGVVWPGSTCNTYNTKTRIISIIETRASQG